MSFESVFNYNNTGMNVTTWRSAVCKNFECSQTDFQGNSIIKCFGMKIIRLQKLFGSSKTDLHGNCIIPNKPFWGDRMLSERYSSINIHVNVAAHQQQKQCQRHFKEALHTGMQTTSRAFRIDMLRKQSHSLGGSTNKTKTDPLLWFGNSKVSAMKCWALKTQSRI